MCFISDTIYIVGGGQPFLAGVDLFFFLFALQHQTRAPISKYFATPIVS